MLNIIWQRKHRWLGHVRRKEVLPRDITERKMKGNACCCGRKFEYAERPHTVSKYMDSLLTQTAVLVSNVSVVFRKIPA